MSSSELLAEILSLSSGLNSFNNFQILNLDKSNSLFSFAPSLLSFSQSCDGELNQLLRLSQSSIFNNIIANNLNLAGGLSPCLSQLLGLEQLVISGSDNVQLSNGGSGSQSISNSSVSNSNVTSVSNSTAAVGSAGNSTAARASNSTQAKKSGKRDEIVARSGANKKQVLGSLGLGVMVFVEIFAL